LIRRPFKLLVANYIGAVGKSTITRHVIGPALPTPWLAVESFDDAGGIQNGAGKHISAEDFEEILRFCHTNEVAAFDVGTSEIQLFLNGFFEHSDDLLNDTFDVVIVPVTLDERVVNDFIQFVADLVKWRLPPSKIRIVFNKVRPRRVGRHSMSAQDLIQKHCHPLIELHNETRKFCIEPEAYLTHSNVYSKLRDAPEPTTVEEAARTDRDFEQELLHASTPEQKLEIGDAKSLCRMASRCVPEVQRVRKALLEDFMSEKGGDS